MQGESQWRDSNWTAGDRELQTSSAPERQGVHFVLARPVAVRLQPQPRQRHTFSGAEPLLDFRSCRHHRLNPSFTFNYHLSLPQKASSNTNQNGPLRIFRLRRLHRRATRNQSRRHQAAPDRSRHFQCQETHERTFSLPAPKSPNSPQFFLRVSSGVPDSKLNLLYLQRVNENCFHNCITTPGSTMTPADSTCISQCMEKYISLWNSVSKTYISRAGSSRETIAANTLFTSGEPSS